MGTGRGEQVTAMRDLPKTWCVVAVPSVGVSTPAAFKAWDALVAERIDSTGHLQDTRANAGILRFAQDDDLKGIGKDDDLKGTGKDDDLKGGGQDNGVEAAGGDDWGEGGRLTSPPPVDKLQELSLAYSSLSVEIGGSKPGTSGILRDQSSEKQRDSLDETQEYALKNLAENTLLALVRTGIGNDFEEVVFPQYPSLRITKRQLMGSDLDGSAIYAALSGSGSALFGLYRSERDAKAAQLRVQSEAGVQVFLTETLPRAEYWERMFAG